MEPQLILVRSFAKANDLSLSTIYRLVRDGALKITKVRSRSYLTKTEAERWLASLSTNNGGEHHAA